ncbi:polyprenyl synthetase family protein [Microbacterium trichothecenolyticum]|uniref:polyprenyl synthetase family protein n=1 Tax=Microbacterium trichothecenolyticum TaxID=69370 RepID=UPI001C6E291A|nr:polyprenyl synthetase family protein [Microbacterium trichothecenolyticum]MBW9118510.1 polyprenyl synthetase family protein [Microbacterium trichothecenolyticum]
MIPAAADPDLRIAIDGALARIRERASELGPAFGALGDAITRAAQGGKRLRPALVTASFDAFRTGDANASAVLSVAAAFELLHTAFVVHDDVIDHDTMRRGVPNIGGEFRRRAQDDGADNDGAALVGDAAAILAGDILLHEAFRLVAMAHTDDATRDRLLTLLDDAVLISAAGELADVENSVAARHPSRISTLDTAFNKTAVYTFRAPLQAGALLGGADGDALRVLGDAGGRLGLAFQLVDDLIGAFGTTAQTGRDTGPDLRENKRTPLVALARESGAAPRVDEALALARTGPVAVREAQLVLEQTGARERMVHLVEETLAAVREASHDPALPHRAGALLRTLADGIEGRIP